MPLCPLGPAKPFPRVCPHGGQWSLAGDGPGRLPSAEPTPAGCCLCSCLCTSASLLTDSWGPGQALGGAECYMVLLATWEAPGRGHPSDLTSPGDRVATQSCACWACCGISQQPAQSGALRPTPALLLNLAPRDQGLRKGQPEQRFRSDETRLEILHPKAALASPQPTTPPLVNQGLHLHAQTQQAQAGRWGGLPRRCCLPPVVTPRGHQALSLGALTRMVAIPWSIMASPDVWKCLAASTQGPCAQRASEGQARSKMAPEPLSLTLVSHHCGLWFWSCWMGPSLAGPATWQRPQDHPTQA